MWKMMQISPIDVLSLPVIASECDNIDLVVKLEGMYNRFLVDRCRPTSLPNDVWYIVSLFLERDPPRRKAVVNRPGNYLTTSSSASLGHGDFFVPAAPRPEPGTMPVTVVLALALFLV